MIRYHFYPRSPCGERLDSLTDDVSTGGFLSTLSLRRATGIIDIINNIINDFYPRSPCGERPGKGPAVKGYRNFYPRSPCGERHSCNLQYTDMDYFYPRSPCGERRAGRGHVASRQQFLSTLSLRRATMRCDSRPLQGPISIHALLAESDALHWRIIRPDRDFYPRSPCGERRASQSYSLAMILFLSTLSLRRATLANSSRAPPTVISIHALLAESDQSVTTSFQGGFAISIHALLAESDDRQQNGPVRHSGFLSTLSLRRATQLVDGVARCVIISIHALLAESDVPQQENGQAATISIHALLAESDTALKTIKALFDTISIHALLAESDVPVDGTFLHQADFYPRSPCGERPTSKRCSNTGL